MSEVATNCDGAPARQPFGRGGNGPCSETSERVVRKTIHHHRCNNFRAGRVLDDLGGVMQSYTCSLMRLGKVYRSRADREHTTLADAVDEDRCVFPEPRMSVQ